MRTLLVGLVLALLPFAASAGVVEGRLVLDGEPVAGLRVNAYAGYDLAAAPAAVSAPSDAEGHYRLELPAGAYALTVRDPQRGLFGFCGFNPVQVADATVWAGLQLIAVHPEERAPYDSPYAGSLSGTVLHAGRPLAGAFGLI